MKRKSFGVLLSVSLFILSFYIGSIFVPTFGFNSKPYSFLLFVSNFVIFGLLISFVIQKYFYPHKKKVFWLIFLLILVVFFLQSGNIIIHKMGSSYDSNYPSQSGIEANNNYKR